MKIEALGVIDISPKVVNEGKDKVLEVLRYIVFELGCIPSEIIVYEDRPEYFIDYRNLIQEIL